MGNIMRRVLKWLGIGVGTMVAVVVAGLAVTLVVAGMLYDMKKPVRTAGGLLRHSSQYLRMSDGVRIAVDIALPANMRTGAKIPVLIKGTPYWRGANLSFLGKAAAEFGLFNLGEPDVEILNGFGYAVVTVDARGTGASFGHVAIMMDDREIADFGEIVDWAAAQPWSNGRVGAYGFSYRGMLATDTASLGHKALKAIAPSFDFTDIYLTTYPGGILSDKFIYNWGAQTKGLNNGQFPCDGTCRLFVAGPERVDADTDGTLQREAVAGHRANYDVYACTRAAPDRDSRICSSGKSLSDISELAHKNAIEASGVPIYSIAGWFDDGSPAMVLRRFETFSNPQEATIGALSHGGFMSTDPFAPTGANPDPRYAKQTAGIAAFFDRYLKPGGKPLGGKTLHYFVLNGGGWKTANAWPPADARAVDWYFGNGKSLVASRSNGTDSYKIDFSASSGPLARHLSPEALSRTAYPDRVEQDKKLLTYTSDLLPDDLEIAGDPLAKLTLSTTAADGEVIVYLEVVSAGGKVTYLTEGELRLEHRKLHSVASSADPLHSYLSADAAPMVPGKAETIEIGLMPIAVCIRKGERIRVAIAGADNANLARIPAVGDPTLKIDLGQSEITLPEVTARE
jgi:putative CocE/NonD family hydrolase